MIHVTAAVARRIEAAETSLMTAIGASVAARLGPERLFVRPVAGGVAIAAGPASPYSKVAGLGFAPLADEDLEAVEVNFAGLRTPVRVELASLADPEIGRRLSSRGYALTGYENVLGLSLAELAAAPPPPGIEIVPVGAADAAEWLEVVATGFMNPDVFDGAPPTEVIERSSIEDVFEDMARVPDFSMYVARRAGEAAGGASLRMHGGVAQLCGAATLPPHRRQGIQTALFHERLARAGRAGCDIATVTTAPGSKSEENARRQGFALLYVRAVLVKPV